MRFTFCNETPATVGGRIAEMETREAKRKAFAASSNNSERAAKRKKIVDRPECVPPASSEEFSTSLNHPTQSLVSTRSFHSMPLRNRIGAPGIEAPIALTRLEAEPQAKPKAKSVKAQEGPTIFRIPVKTPGCYDIWVEILQHCPPKFLLRAHAISPDFKTALKSELIWKTARYRYYGGDCPDPPEGMKERRFAKLLTGITCELCDLNEADKLRRSRRTAKLLRGTKEKTVELDGSEDLDGSDNPDDSDYSDYSNESAESDEPGELDDPKEAAKLERAAKKAVPAKFAELTQARSAKLLNSIREDKLRAASLSPTKVMSSVRKVVPAKPAKSRGKVYWAFQARLCDECLQEDIRTPEELRQIIEETCQNFVDKTLAAQLRFLIDRFTECIPEATFSKSRQYRWVGREFYSKSALDDLACEFSEYADTFTFKDRLLKKDETKACLNAWLDVRAAKNAALVHDLQIIEAWERTWNIVRRLTRNPTIKRDRIAFFTARALAMDPPLPIETLEQCSAYKKAIKIATPYTERAWRVLASKLKRQRGEVENHVPIAVAATEGVDDLEDLGRGEEEGYQSVYS